MVSNCHLVTSGRTAYAKQLKQFISVDIYGRCGTLTCSTKDKELCRKMVSRDYKFYLSFENSLCEEYISEKIWNILRFDIYVIPIVLGAGEYWKFLPPHSHINVKDYESPRHLAEYLHKLDKDPALYNEYFAWRSQYIVLPYPSLACDLCRYLNHVQKHPEPKVYDRLDMYWDKKTQCSSPETLFTNVSKDSWR